MTSKETRKVIIYSMYKYLLKHNMLSTFLQITLKLEQPKEERKLLMRDIRRYLYLYAFRRLGNCNLTIEEQNFLYNILEEMVKYVEQNIEQYKLMKYDKTTFGK